MVKCVSKKMTQDRYYTFSFVWIARCPFKAAKLANDFEQISQVAFCKL